MKRLAVFIAATILAGSCSPKAPQVRFKYAERRGVLKSNGLRVVVIPDKTTAMVQVDVRYEVGSNEDPPGKAGIAHLVEHMMFQHRMLGPDKPPTFDLLPQIALTFNAYTTYDKTHYYLVGAKEDLEGLLKVEAFRMNALCETIPKEQFDREREVVRNEIRQRGGTPEGLMPDLVLQAVYPKGHPYSHTTGGNDEQLSSITFEDVCTFMNRYYTPERATVIVTGNVADPDATIKMVNDIFHGIPKRSPAPRLAVTPIETHYKKVEYLLDIERPVIFVVWPTVARTSKEWTKVGALFSAVFRIADEADEWEVANNVGAIPPGVFGGNLAPVFALYMELPAGGSVDEALDLVWSKTKNAGYGLKILDFDKETKQFARMNFVEGLESLAGRAESVADEIQFSDGTVTFDSNQEFLLKRFREIDTLSADGYADFAKKTLDKDKAVVVVFKPSGKGKKGDKRSSLAFSGKSHDKQPEPLVDPAEAKRPLPAPKSKSLISSAERYTLGNGMNVILLPTGDQGLPIMHAQLQFNVGAANEPKGKAGLAGVAAGFLRPPKDANFRQFISFGSDVDDDHTTFISRGLNAYSDVVIEGLERSVRIGEYDQELIEKWQKRTKDNLSREDTRRGLAYSQEVWKALYGPEHPYTVNGQPTQQSISNIGYDAASAWKREHYTAKNATLIVVGNFNVKAVKSKISDTFGDWDGGHQDRPAPATRPQNAGPTHIGVVGKERPQLDVFMAYPAPAGVDGQLAARMVLAEMMSARIEEIRKELGSTYGMRASRTLHLGPNAYEIGVGGGPGKVDAARAGESLRAMRDKIDSLRKGVNFDTTFALARRAVMRRLLIQSSETFALADRLGTIAAFGLGPEHYDQLIKYVAAVSPAQVKALIESELDPKNEVLVCMADRKTLEKAFKEAGLTSVKYVEPK
jgi:zinc protease